jgi:hypothetical protein
MSEDEDLEAFLDFLEKDIAAGNVNPFGGEMARRAASLVKGMDIDLDAPLEDEVDI